MTTHHAGYHVVLDKDIREDDAEWTINAIRMIKGVANVTPVVASFDQVMARVRRDSDWAEKLQKMIQDQRLAPLHKESFE